MSTEYDAKTMSDINCKRHGASQTPMIDSYLQTPSTRENILALSEALAELADEDHHCTKCATDTVGQVIASFISEAKLAKKNKGFTKEDKKALKKETKLLFKGMKKNVEGNLEEKK